MIPFPFILPLARTSDRRNLFYSPFSFFRSRREKERENVTGGEDQRRWEWKGMVKQEDRENEQRREKGGKKFPLC